VSAGGKTESGESLSRDLSTGVDNLKKLGVQRKQELVDQFRSSEGFEEVRRSNRDATQRVESSARESQSFRETEQVELARSQQLSAKIEGAERFARESSANWANSLDQYARARFGMSVHDGVADPRKWQSVVTSFIEAGSVRNDAPDGKLMWIPPDAGLGPNAVSPQLVQGAQGVAAGGQAALQGRFDEANPRGGAQGVRDAQAPNDARVTKEQQRLGVRPTGTVSAQQTKTKVGTGQGAAAAAASAAAASTREEQGEAQIALDQRSTKVSDFHRPIGGGANAALDTVRGTDGAERAFSAEAAEEAKRRQDADVRFYADIGKAQIPTAPTPEKKERK
jgi:hypothetical protein